MSASGSPIKLKDGILFTEDKATVFECPGTAGYKEKYKVRVSIPHQQTRVPHY